MGVGEMAWNQNKKQCARLPSVAHEYLRNSLETVSVAAVGVAIRDAAQRTAHTHRATPKRAFAAAAPCRWTKAQAREPSSSDLHVPPA